jgi:hypothetical protein
MQKLGSTERERDREREREREGKREITTQIRQQSPPSLQALPYNVYI